MKRHFIWAVAALGLAAAFSVGCTTSQNLTPKKIVKEFNTMLEKEGDAEVYADLTVGTYECNSSSARLRLAQLETAGVIDYTVTRYAWWEKEEVMRQKPYQVEETRSSWYYTWTETVTRYRWVEETVYNFEDHYVVNVTLTSAGKRLLAELPEAEYDEDEELASKEVDPSTYKWNKKDLSEDWPYIPNPFLKPEPADTTKATQSTPASTSTPQYADHDEEIEIEEDEVERIDEKQYEAYCNLSLYHETVTLKAGAVKAINARYILVTEQNGIQTAEAEVIMETCEATDAGRILIGFENGRRDSEDVELIHYLDKGWVLGSLEK